MGSTVKIYDVDKPTISIPYWQVAALGIVPVLGLGGFYYYYYRNKNKKHGKATTQQNGVMDKKLVQEQETDIKQSETVTGIDKDPVQRAQTLKVAGNKFFKDGNHSDAIRCYSEAIDLCPPTEIDALSTLYQNRAACYDQLGNLEETVKECTSALELNPKYTKALTRRAKALQSLERLPQCLEDITAICILENFQNTQSLEMADNILKKLGTLHAAEAFKNREPIQSSTCFIKSFFSTFSNDPVIKPSDFEANISIPQDGEPSLSHLERAKQLLLRGNYDDVIPACTEAVEQGEGLEPEALLLRATMYILRCQYSLALDDLETIINSQVQNVKITVNALIKRSSIYLQFSDKEKGMEDLKTAENLDPNNPDVYLHRGQFELLTDNIEQSLLDFEKCVKLAPSFALAVMQGHYAQYRFAVKQSSITGVAKIIEKFKRDIRKFPKCVEGYVLLAQALMDQQQYDDADMNFQKATKIDPSNASLRVHRGLLYLQWKGDVEKAVILINEGIQIDDKCCFCYETLGTIEVQRGNLKNAVEMFGKAIPLSKSELELAHMFSLLDAALAQLAVTKRLGLTSHVGT